MKRSKRQKSSRRGAGIALAVLFLALTGVLLLRTSRPAAPPAVPLATPTDVPAAADPAAEATQTEPPEESSPAASEQTPAPETPDPTATPRQGSGYNAETYQLVSDMIYIRRTDAPDGDAQIRALEEQLRERDPELGATWTGIMDYWEYANREMPINAALPDDLPQDDSLCLVVLGFQLLYDGDMAPELLGRCELALRCARQYPNAYIAVTGGGTAGNDRSVTEAGVMAEWFLAQGIAPERIIREDASLTTDQNALNTCAILIRDYPQITRLAVVTSDYHMPLGCTMFTEAALLCGFYLGEVPYTVVSNAAYSPGASLPGYKGMKNQASYVWILADPKYG